MQQIQVQQFDRQKRQWVGPPAVMFPGSLSLAISSRVPTPEQREYAGEIFASAWESWMRANFAGRPTLVRIVDLSNSSTLWGIDGHGQEQWCPMRGALAYSHQPTPMDDLLTALGVSTLE